MLIISLAGIGVAPFMVVVVSYILMKTNPSMDAILFERLFADTNLYLILLIGVPLYGVVTAYLFNR